MMELKLTLDFVCCGCEDTITVTVKCARQKADPGPRRACRQGAVSDLRHY